MYYPWHLYVMSFFYIIAGLNHFRTPAMYIKIIPNYFQFRSTLNIVSGIIEILLGVLLLIPNTKSNAAWGIIFFLIAVFPANLHMYQNRRAGLGFPKFLLLIRLPFQLVLMYWAYLYTNY